MNAHIHKTTYIYIYICIYIYHRMTIYAVLGYIIV